MKGAVRFIQVLVTLAGSLSFLCVSITAAERPSVVATIDRAFTENGWYSFHISERGTGPTGRYERTFSFKASIQGGVAVPSEFRDYQAIMSTERAGIWRTHREPRAGYVFLFLKEGRPYVELQLIEAWDGHPTRMSVNGIHRLQVHRESS